MRQSGEMRKELAHYIKRKYTKGSKEEITAKRKEIIRKREGKPENETNQIIKGNTEAILHPKIITYDFETDTHTNIHKPNHVEVDILQIDENETHDYDKCLKHSFGINGYNCTTEFCNWLFTEENSDATVIAHKWGWL
jgi:hypothetical protein